ncbi:Alkaline phosphatase [Opitutaceae bacterium TAV1]|nr:Alkaline phosphatase [Opitutaceae bacterium TAV1]
MNTVTKAFLIRGLAGAALAGAALAPAAALAAPVVSRLTPPSLKFSYGDDGAPYISRFFIDQRFDLQATVSPDAGRTITGAKFLVDDVEVPGTVTFIPCNAPGLPADTVAPTLRAYSNATPGVHTLKVVATQDDDTTVEAEGNFEVVGFTVNGRQAKNVIFMIGDGMGIAHRSAARIMYRGIVSGKALAPLEMDDMPATALVKTASLNSIITDSAPGAACYSSGNKGNNNQQGVFPDDTTDAFDNPRVELIGEYLARTQQKSLGIVTTADVFDATPGAFGSHTQDRGAGTGICDGYLDEQVANANLKVLLGGGRKWFLPGGENGETGSARSSATGSTISAELAAAWNLTPGTSDPSRDLIADFQDAGFTYTPDRTALATLPTDTTKLLGLFAFSNMNVAKDKLDGRRGITPAGATQSVVADYGFTDQPLLEEMTDAALRVLNKNRKGFVLMVEGASIDKQAHNMDTERWITDTIEFDKAIGVAKQFAAANPDTLIIVTADHECAGVNIIGASRVTDANLKTLASAGGGATTLRDQVVGTYEFAGFPIYTLADDGYPQTTDIDYRMLVGYAANCDRYEDWLTNPRPLRDSQQPLNGVPPLNTYPGAPTNRDQAGDFLVTGQVPGTQAVHTGSDIPLTATGRASSLFRGVVDNTDVFFLAMQAIHGGASY